MHAGFTPTVWCLGVILHTLMLVPKIDNQSSTLKKIDLRSGLPIRNNIDDRRTQLERLARRSLLSLVLYAGRSSGQRVGLALRLPWRLELVRCLHTLPPV